MPVNGISGLTPRAQSLAKKIGLTEEQLKKSNVKVTSRGGKIDEHELLADPAIQSIANAKAQELLDANQRKAILGENETIEPDEVTAFTDSVIDKAPEEEAKPGKDIIAAPNDSKNLSVNSEMEIDLSPVGILGTGDVGAKNTKYWDLVFKLFSMFPGLTNAKQTIGSITSEELATADARDLGIVEVVLRHSTVNVMIDGKEQEISYIDYLKNEAEYLPNVLVHVKVEGEEKPKTMTMAEYDKLKADPDKSKKYVLLGPISTVDMDGVYSDFKRMGLRFKKKNFMLLFGIDVKKGDSTKISFSSFTDGVVFYNNYFRAGRSPREFQYVRNLSANPTSYRDGEEYALFILNEPNVEAALKKIEDSESETNKQILAAARKRAEAEAYLATARGEEIDEDARTVYWYTILYKDRFNDHLRTACEVRTDDLYSSRFDLIDGPFKVSNGAENKGYNQAFRDYMESGGETLPSNKVAKEWFTVMRRARVNSALNKLFNKEEELSWLEQLPETNKMPSAKSDGETAAVPTGQ